MQSPLPQRKRASFAPLCDALTNNPAPSPSVPIFLYTCTVDGSFSLKRKQMVHVNKRKNSRTSSQPRTMTTMASWTSSMVSPARQVAQTCSSSGDIMINLSTQNTLWNSWDSKTPISSQSTVLYSKTTLVPINVSPKTVLVLCLDGRLL